MKYIFDETREVEQYFFSDPEKGRFFQASYPKAYLEKAKRRRGLKPVFRPKKREIWN